MIIGLGHTKGVGKDTVAGILVRNYKFKAVAFADPLKAGAQAVFGLTDAQMHDQTEKEKLDPFWNVTPRYILQRFGTECMRDGFDQDIWVNALKRRLDPSQDYVISDLRFRNEAAALKHWGARLVKVTRPGYELAPNAHQSERELVDFTGWDAVIHNTGSLADLDDIVASILFHI